jgi:hypothetical protein
MCVRTTLGNGATGKIEARTYAEDGMNNWRCSCCHKFVHPGTSVCAVCVADRMPENGLTARDLADTKPETVQEFQGKDFLRHSSVQ